MSDMKRRRPRQKPQRVRLPDGTWAVFMGETGADQVKDKGSAGQSFADKGMPPESASQNANPAPARPEREISAAMRGPGANINAPSERGRLRNERAPGASRMRGIAIPEAERREIERRRAEAQRSRQMRMSKDPRARGGVEKDRAFYKRIADRIYMRWMAISIDIADILRGSVIAFLVLLFALLQTTLFKSFRLFGAVPDLMLPLVIAVGITEGDRWGGITGLVSAVLIESIGGTGLALLALLYAPVGFISGIFSTFYFRDSLPVRAIYIASACLVKCVFTVICTVHTFGRVDVGLMLGSIVVPEYFSTLIMSVIPQAAAYFALKPFHKSRAERVY